MAVVLWFLTLLFTGISFTLAAAGRGTPALVCGVVAVVLGVWLWWRIKQQEER